MMASGGLWHYLGSFIFYTLAAIGLLYAAYWQLKKNPGLLTFSKSGRFAPESLQVESCLPLEARKNLYVIRAGQERFLLASSPEGTQFLSRLEAASLAQNEAEEPVGLQPLTHSRTFPGFWQAGLKLFRQQLPQQEV